MFLLIYFCTLILAVNAALRISDQSVTYFQFQFLLLSAFIPWLTERERLSSDYSTQNLRQRGPSHHTVKANELRTKTLSG